MTDWKIFQGNGEPTLEDAGGEKATKAQKVEELPVPPWRDFARIDEQRAETYKPPPDAVEIVNAALYLRRPILVTGQPGTGKTSLIYAVAKELGLGSVLTWPINSRSTLNDGLYRYDAVARLRQARIEREASSEAGGAAGGEAGGQAHAGPDAGRQGRVAAARDEKIGRFLKLGPLGTAFLPGKRPRALLIDEIDKSDVDLPNDLLHIFEEGAFEIPELVRISAEQPRVEVSVTTARRREKDKKEKQAAIVENGRVRCATFPFVVITSNGERDLPPAFLRRCLRLDLGYPTADQLSKIVLAHLPKADGEQLAALIKEFRDRQKAGAVLATDQLLNTVFMMGRGLTADGAEGGAEAEGEEKARAKLKEILMRKLESR